MRMKTRAQLIESVLNTLALVSGSSVQIYTEPIISEHINTAFDIVFKKRFWPHLTFETYHELDGAAGVVTDNTIVLDDLSDIQWVRKYPYTEENNIPYFKEGLFGTSQEGYTGIPYDDEAEQYETKRIKFNPLTLDVDICIRARRHPGEITSDATLVPMDYLLIQHFVSAALLDIDGMNPSAKARQDLYFNDRYKTLVDAEQEQAFVSVKSRFASDFTVAEDA